MIPRHPLLQLGPIPIHTFGLLLALAFLAAGWAASREFERRGYDPELASSTLVWAAVGGIVGARLWLVLDAWGEFVRAPLEFLLTGGGFVFYGGLLGGALGATVVFRRHGIPWLRGADMVAPAIALGQAVGRLGCQLSGDGDWGRATTLAWGVQYRHAVVCGVPPCSCAPDGACVWPADVWVHPTPVYEMLGYAVVFAVLWRWRRAALPDGTLFAWYLVLAGAVRFLVEFMRLNPPTPLGLTQAQVASLLLAAIGAGLLLVHRAWRPAAA